MCCSSQFEYLIQVLSIVLRSETWTNKSLRIQKSVEDNGIGLATQFFLNIIRLICDFGEITEDTKRF